MAIVKMKRLSLYAMACDRDALLRKLQKLGCVDVSEPGDKRTSEEWLDLATPDTPDQDLFQRQAESVRGALALLDQYAPAKSSFLAPKPQIEVSDLFDDEREAQALQTAAELNDCRQAISDLDSQIGQTSAALAALKPWVPLDVPLDLTDTAQVHTRFFTLPATVQLSQVYTALNQAADASALYEASSDHDLHYLLLLVHKSQQEAADDALKPFGPSNVAFKDYTGSAAQEAAALEQTLEQLKTQRQAQADRAAGYADWRERLQICADRLSQELSKETARSKLWTTKSAIFLEGWVPEQDVPRLEKALSGFDCAWDLRDPLPEETEEVPVKLQNNRFTRSLNVVTNMYSLPAYDGVDPNPLMAPFFILFFGIMMADMGYGLLMVIAALVVLGKSHPRESTRNFMELVLWCGISTFIVGALTGGFFGDFIPQLLKIINPDSTFEMPALFTPLNDTIAIMLGSLVLGVLQILTGMTVSVIEKCKKGEFIDALFEEITWFIILVGVALAALGVGSVAGIPVVLVIGALMLIFGGTRNAKGFGKVTSLVGLVYNGVTGYFSDILSYVRLMALMLSGSVIAQVFNTLGSVFGNVVMFVIISMIGNALNLALNLLGCYVHDLRLQCLEFFNRFYKEGGVPFSPLAIQTTSVDVIKEEQ